MLPAFAEARNLELVFPRLLAQAETAGDGIVQQALLPEPRLADEALSRGLADGPARYVSLYGLLCSGGTCLTRTPQGVPLQWDYGHLTFDGALAVLALAAQKGAFP